MQGAPRPLYMGAKQRVLNKSNCNYVDKVLELVVAVIYSCDISRKVLVD